MRPLHETDPSQIELGPDPGVRVAGGQAQGQPCQAVGADPDDWPEMQRTAKGLDAASKQIDALIAIEEAYKGASGDEAEELAGAGVEDARNGGGARERVHQPVQAS